ncbi:transferrin-binding protein-like solute binding protein [Neisseria sp. Dent CA1/247]|uniref:Slam-dependent surface lipoprotein n=1 Tax=Neisseria sp. Dent CA1/247 TaxID=2912675 RepID=UPI001FD55AA7|nr:Slam-dependent surface lipoprotein [Neisseria sp. Dent CA1/247]UOO75862.1 transferrin-binding protein-like solute binding protein [Neisseria sp. Dent CA1/247]
MKHILLAVSVSSALILGACGGGGGSNSPSTDSTPTGNTSTGNTSTGNTSTGNTSTGNTSTGNTSTGNTSTGSTSTGSTSTGSTSTGSTSTGSTSTGSTSTGSTSTGSTSTGSTSTGSNSTGNTPMDSSESIVIFTTPDGTKINLDLKPKGAITHKTTDGTLKGWNQGASFYGAWLNNSKQFQEISYQGTLTPEKNIPNTGTATYYGNAVRNDSIDEKILMDAKSRIHVNFGRKTVNGTIEMPGLRRNITLHEGRLNGAQYSGNASVFGNSGGRYEGGLFGKNYEETAGVVKFDNNSSLDTAFGGKRY